MNSQPINDPFESLFTTIVHHSRDWAANRRDAWIYGIVCGWDDASLADLEAQFRWGSEETERLKVLREAFMQVNAKFLTAI